MIVSAELGMRWRRRVAGRAHFSFAAGLNTLVGPNGSGKSTVLRALLDDDDCRLQLRGNPLRVWFDTERMNPRVIAGPAPTPHDMALRLSGMFSSHGQSLRRALATLDQLEGGTTLLIDEPEAGLDLESAERLQSALRSAAGAGIQVIIASHHPVFWRDSALIELRDGYVAATRSRLAALLEAAADEPE